jgi:hypothetical protein
MSTSLNNVQTDAANAPLYNSLLYQKQPLDHHATPSLSYDDDPSDLAEQDVGLPTEEIRVQTMVDHGHAALSNGQGNVDGHQRIQDFLQDLMGGSLGVNGGTITSGLLSGTRTPKNLFDFGGETDWALNDIDLGFLEDYNQHIPFGAEPDTASTNTASALPNVPPGPPTGVDATRKWRFLPAPKDSSDANMSLPTTGIHRRFEIERRVLTETLSHSTRDNILTMVATAGSIMQPITSFPSTELLDSLLQFFLSTTTASNYVCHTATFNPNRRPILTAAMVAAGAALTPDAPLQKLGLAFQEAVRLTLATQVGVLTPLETFTLPVHCTFCVL